MFTIQSNNSNIPNNLELFPEYIDNFLDMHEVKQLLPKTWNILLCLSLNYFVCSSFWIPFAQRQISCIRYNFPFIVSYFMHGPLSSWMRSFPVFDSISILRAFRINQRTFWSNIFASFAKVADIRYGVVSQPFIYEWNETRFIKL